MMRWLSLLFLATCLDVVAQTPPVPAPPAAPARVEQSKLGPAFRAACWKGDLATVKLLYAQGAPLEGRDNLNRTPLFLACHGDPDVVGFLLAQGAKIDAAEKGGDLPITHACQYGDLASAKLLVSAGANVNVVNDAGQTPLMLAAQEGHNDLVSFLIDQHVDVNFESKSDPALFYATGMDHPTTAKLLLDAGAHLTYSPTLATSKISQLPILSMAVQTNDTGLVDILLAHGADINGTSTAGETTLMRAVQAADAGMIEHLVYKGADVNLQDPQGRTALMLSVNFQQPQALEYLIDHGANLDARDHQNRTALIWACSVVYNPVIRFLIEKGADIDAVDSLNETPLTYAGDRGDKEMVQLFKNKGAKQTILHIIAKDKPSTPLSPAHTWALAVSALYDQENGQNPWVLGGAVEPGTSQQRLKQDWNISAKADLLRALDGLNDRGYPVEFQEKGARLESLTGRSLDLFLLFSRAFSWLLSEPDHSTEIMAARDSYLRWKRDLAGNLCRAANLISAGFNVKYLNEKESWDLLMPIARQTQKNFHSWKDLGDNFLDAREIWSGNRDPSFSACTELLLNPQDTNSPWNQSAWGTDLSGD
jgi:ankyrin repeat protein